ncbi:hypothetical protein NC981_21605 [Leptolyngbya sp. DQ-M1]|uniref:hypothetical protein n=1 Tax=Leptolyngbya sp. DQ-M1 TaxID=2933920 RepID=UPI00329A4DFB
MKTETVVQICEFIEKVNGIESQLQSLSSSVASLEQCYDIESDEALAADDAASIQVLVDRAKQFTENHLFYQLNQVTEVALIEIRKFHDLHHRRRFFLPDEVYDSLRLFLSVHKRSLAGLREGVKTLEEISQYDDFTQTNQLGEWAEGLERFGDALEDNIPFFDFETLEALLPLLYDVIKQARKKSGTVKTIENRKESFRVRIRSAAGFLTRLIESLREESEAEDQEIIQAISVANHPAFFED